MRALIQRVSHASVTVEGECVGKIEKGLLVLLGVGPQDTEKQADKKANKQGCSDHAFSTSSLGSGLSCRC